MTTRTYDVVNGNPLAVPVHLDAPACLARKRDVEARMSALKGDPAGVEEREALKLENAALDARLRELREEGKREGVRRNFAGIGSPLHEVLVDRFPAVLVAELERAALGKLAERERRSAERKAARAGE